MCMSNHIIFFVVRFGLWWWGYENMPHKPYTTVVQDSFHRISHLETPPWPRKKTGLWQ